MSCCYLIHFDKPVGHAQHYLGWSKYSDPHRRVEHHFNGRGSRLTKAVKEAGIKMILVRIWKDGDRQLERYLKKKKASSRICPMCNSKLKRYMLTSRKQESF